MRHVDHISGQTFHGRKGKVENAFRYSVDYCLLDPEQAQGPALFSRNRRNLTALHDRDHGGAPGEGRGVAWVREVLQAHQLDKADGDILLLAQPRVLGHVFNPVSFWLCHGRDGSLRAVIAEVTNTYGDRHSYLCHHPDQRPITRHERLSAQKIFHVSPFQPVAGDYRFRFDIRDDRLGIWIDYCHGDTQLLATLTGRRRRLTNRAILWAALRRPLGSRRVLGLIHWQALVLWWKGARWHVRPEPPADEVSR
ncbi:DUF1365 domain-containing protein [Fluviibacterium sp. DFM31]|uniref:DUF1365 domain-containing protein n=1 Tax=Meridianimarinicoccus marinus TaxID=3231483 RepID=A0ABV3L8M1_9RHOB